MTFNDDILRICFAKDDEEGASDGGEKLDSEGKDYLDKLTNALKKNQKIPYKPRVQGWNREKVVPGGSQDRVSRLSTAKPDDMSKGDNESQFDNDPVPPQQTPASEAPDPRRSSGNVPRPQFTHQNPIGTFPMGTILHFEDNSIGIYKDVRPGKEYEVILMLREDGSAEAQGIALETYDLKAIGYMTPEFVLRIQRRKAWERDEVVFHLNAFDYCELIPQQSGSAAPQAPRRSQSSVATPKQNITPPPSTGTPKPTQPSEKSLTPGREITINFGNQEWKAIYWGEDDLGTIIAHQTNDEWQLMHMDLRRFKDSLVLGDLIDRTLLDTIHAQVGK